ncbi:MAG TPA: hypothetical protein VMU04_10350 [Candidatus Acidoferrum sp.]|nr:hypothetical protein [Candidatus Acidoferrum sp.]
MTRTKPIPGHCQHCGGPLEFPAESIGLMAPCPHCHQQTELMLATPPQEPLIPRRVFVWTLLTIVLMLAGVAAGLIELKKLERKADDARRKRAIPVQLTTNEPGR